jgi:hypothetical protein
MIDPEAGRCAGQPYQVGELMWKMFHNIQYLMMMVMVMHVHRVTQEV